MNHDELARWLWAKGAGSDRLKVDALAALLLEAFDVTGRDPLSSDAPGTCEYCGQPAPADSVVCHDHWEG